MCLTLRPRLDNSSSSSKSIHVSLLLPKFERNSDAISAAAAAAEAIFDQNEKVKKA